MSRMPFDSTSPPFPSSTGTSRIDGDRLVAAWLFAVAAMVVVMVALGGATRLTGSGLSIMEWRPLSGWLPPLDHTEWQRLFDLYRTIPQYQQVNRGMSLAAFQDIFWLEYLHRLWGRLIGVVFLGGAIALALAGHLRRRTWARLGLLLALGAAQGGIGWFMVASGFFAHRTAVSPYRLALHLGMALIILGVLTATALQLWSGRARGDAHAARLRPWIAVAGTLAALTMLAGAFVAGIKAGFDYNTFPLMEGRLVPLGYGALDPWHLNLFENVAAVQFNHRLLATLTLMAAIALAARCLFGPALPAAARRAGLVLAGAILCQYGLGVVTLLSVVPVGLGTLHQTVAAVIVVLTEVGLHATRPPAA